MAHWFSGLGLDPVLQIVLTISCQASLLAVIVLTSQSIMGRWLSPRWRYALWSVVVIRLVMPIAPGSTWSIFNLFSSDPVPTVIVPPLPPMPTAEVITYSLSTLDTKITPPPPVSTWGMDDIALAVWLVGMGTVLSVIVAINIALAFRLCRRPTVTDPGLLELLESCKQEMDVRRKVLLYGDPKITSPALAGIFRPSLLIPPEILADLPREELRFIFLHELAHVKKHDIIQNWLLIALAAIHWFNPVIWFTFARLRADRELARDAMVLSATGTDANQAYGQTIIHTLERIARPNLQNPALAGIGDGMGQLKRRLRMISLAPKRRPTLTFIGITLLTTLAVIGLTDAAEPEAPHKTEQITEVAASDEAGSDDEANQSQRHASMKNLLNLGVAVHGYAANNNDQLPPDLGATLAYVDRNSEWTEEDKRPASPQEKARLYLTPQDQKATEIPDAATPQWINENTSYMYLGREDVTLSAIPQDVWATTVLLHERLDAKRPQPDADNQIAVVWCDGHVELLPVELAKQRIAESKKTLEGARQAKTIAPQNFRVEFDQTPLEDAIDQVRDQIDVPLFVNWKALEAAGIERTEPIKMTVITKSSDMLVLTMLRAVSDQEGLYAPAVKMVDGVLTASTVRDLSRTSDTRVYDIRRLLMTGSEGRPLAPRADGTIPERPVKAIDTRAQRVGQIADLIRDTVGFHEEWAAHGGDLSSIQELNGNLIVKTTPENHTKIPSTLAMLGDNRSVQIKFESKILIAPKEFLKEAGVEEKFKTIPDGGRVAFIDELETHTIIQAMHKSPLTRTLAAPSVLQNDGQEASVAIEEQLSCVTDYNTVANAVGTGVDYDPVVETISEGINIKVLGTVSPDMRRIDVTIHPTITNVERPIEKKRWPENPAGNELLIDVPNTSTAETELDLSIPDKATVLIDVGVISGPIDSSDTTEEGIDRHVYMLVKPTIILESANQEE